MLIEIKPATDGTWAVVAHMPDGLHHDFLPTREEAIKYAEEYYFVEVTA